MNATHNDTSTRRRLITAAAVLVTAGAFSAGGLDTAAPADAGPTFVTFGAIAYGSNTGVWATTQAPWASVDVATSQAIKACQNAGGGNCVMAGSVKNGCVALAVGERNAVALNRWQAMVGATKVKAQTFALEANGGGRVAAVSCASPTATDGQYYTRTGRVGAAPF